jgi:transcriptional regulator with GAF, ATPase, and Fis domain
MMYPETQIIGCSKAMDEVFQLIRKIAQSDQNVLIYGETGTGKNLAAKKIHELSRRKTQPLLTINCANIPGELFEAELFGYGKGAFTGAVKEKQGLLETARSGAVFLDEIGELPFLIQAKLLQTIENKELRRVGETRLRKILARFIFATNKDLQDEVTKGKFRKDLFYRINVVSLFMPPLKDRKEDIPLLVEFFLNKNMVDRCGTNRMSWGAIKKLVDYEYPGNIRELENIVTRALLFKNGKTIFAQDISFDNASYQRGSRSGITPKRIQEALEHCRWNKTLAAKEVGKSRRQFYRLLEKYDMLR